jgi:hypothetical protein
MFFGGEKKTDLNQRVYVCGVQSALALFSGLRGHTQESRHGLRPHTVHPLLTLAVSALYG